MKNSQNSTPNRPKSTNTPALALLTTLFFMWGFITCMNDILIPHLKSLFDMDYTKTMLIQFTFFGAYALMSIPSSIIIGKIGYKNGIVLGLAVAGIGAFMFYPASIVMNYVLFLVSFFILATGITILQVAANPYVAILGPPETASSRLTLTQAFNSLGTTIAPVFGAMLILGGTYFAFSESPEKNLFEPSHEEVIHFEDEKWLSYPNKSKYTEQNIKAIFKDRTANYMWLQTDSGIVKFDADDSHTYTEIIGEIDQEIKGFLVKESKKKGPDTLKIIHSGNIKAFKEQKSSTVQAPYIGIAATLFVLALIFVFAKLPVISSARDKGSTSGSAWKHPHLVLGAISIFLYVGAEVAIGSFMVNFFALREIASLSEADAAKYVALYWGGAMIGRFQGAITMSGIKSSKKRYLYMAAIAVLAFALGYWITENIIPTLVFMGFVALNIIACILGKNKPPRTLAVFAGVAVALVSATVIFNGHIAMWSLIAVGLFNSIMFPTIFTLAIEDLGELTSQGSGILNTAIAGGAIIPLVMGGIADAVSLHNAFLITLICYLFIFFYGIKGHKIKKTKTTVELKS